MSHASPAYRLKRPKLFVSCATLAITVALTPQRAWAQAYQGTPTTVSGTVSYARNTPGIETITVGTNTATVNWAPNEQGAGNIVFLPAGNTATYQGAPGLAGFTVLNRIVPTDTTRTIELNGSVLSKLDGGATGGNVWFYSPGGILIGSQAVFDVGGLLLSSIDLPSGFSADANGFSATFSKSAGAAGSIKLMSGAQVNARNSYVAMIAPRIEQGGNVQVNGSTAYAAAEGATMSFSQGLFDIEVPVGAGTSDTNGIVHSGTTGGPANSSGTDHHTIYLVAVPKNQALSMLLGGSIGFAPAATGATVTNGQIILSSGYGFSTLGVSGGTTGPGGIDIGSNAPATFTSDVIGFSNGPVTVDARTNNVSFSGDLVLENDSDNADIELLADSGHTLTVGGDADLISGDKIGASSDHGATLAVTGTLEANAVNSLTLFNDGGLGTFQADTVSFITADVIADNFDGTINNLLGDFTGDFAFDDLTLPGSVTITAAGNLSAGQVTGSSISLFAGGNLSVGDATVTDPAGSALFSAGGLATFTGTISAPSIFVDSADIDIPTGGSLGVLGVTTTLALVGFNDAGMYIGNIAAPSGAYTLNEDGDLHTRTLTITSESTSDGPSPDIFVGDAHIDGSATPGGGIRNIIVGAPSGSIHLLGTVQWDDAGSSDSMTLNAGENIEVNTDTGRLVMTNAAGALAGRLLLNAPNVWIAQGSILSQLEASPNYSGRDLALATNSGTSNPLGFVGSGTITVLPGSTFFVQNSGTVADMGGITVGDGGLFVYNEGAAGIAVTAYGRQLKSDGSSVTNSAFTATVHTLGTFTAGSTINGIAIGSATPPPSPPPSPPPAPPPSPPPAPPPSPPPPPPPPPPTVQTSETVLGPIEGISSPGTGSPTAGSDPTQQAQEQQQEQAEKKSDKQGSSDDDSGVDASLGLINAAPVQLQTNLEQPVTSGGMETLGENPNIPSD